jgi:hypothetical protein
MEHRAWNTVPHHLIHVFLIHDSRFMFHAPCFMIRAPYFYAGQSTEIH